MTSPTESYSEESDAAPEVPLPPTASTPPPTTAGPPLPELRDDETAKRRRVMFCDEKPRPKPKPKPKPKPDPRPLVPLPSMSHLPSNPLYQRSYMHRTVVTHLALTATTLISASEDGRINFWHRDVPQATAQEEKENGKTNLTFIKSIQAHQGVLAGMHLTERGDTLLTTSLTDRSLKVFSVHTFDMTQFTKLAHKPAETIASVQNPDRIIIPFCDTPLLAIFTQADVCAPPRYIRTANGTPLTHIVHNPAFNALVTCDTSCILDYAAVPAHKPVIPDGDEESKSEYEILSHQIPSVNFRSRLQTDLYLLAKTGTKLTCLAISPNGRLFAAATHDNKMRIFDFRKAKIVQEIDENAVVGSTPNGLPEEQLTRRLAREKLVTRDLGSLSRRNVVWDETGAFAVYATVTGVNVLHAESGRLVKILGLRESAYRFVHVVVAHGGTDYSMEGPTGDAGPLIVASAYESERIFLFGCGQESMETNRDVYNERISRNAKSHAGFEQGLRDGNQSGVSAKRCTLHTSLGDVMIALFAELAPKAVQNFVGLARKEYFDGVLFHRVVRGFMIQTGDPDGDGTGGESIWGGCFEDEFDDSCKHQVGSVSMANVGPDTNGSVRGFMRLSVLVRSVVEAVVILTLLLLRSFCSNSSLLLAMPVIWIRSTQYSVRFVCQIELFIIVLLLFMFTDQFISDHDCSLHTGKVVNGMGIARQIESAKTDKKDRPIDPIRIESVSVHTHPQ